MNRKISILKKLDTLIGPFAVSAVKTLIRPRSEVKKVPSSFLFIRPGGIGDAVLLIPSIKDIKSAYPEAQIDILCEKRNGEIFELCSEIDAVLLYDSPRGLFTALKSGYDVVIDSEQWYRLSAVIAYLTRAPLRIGFGTNERKKLFTDNISYRQDEHEIYSFLNLIRDLIPGQGFNEDEPFILIPDKLSETVEDLLPPLDKKRVVAIFPGGSVPEKRWPIDRFRQVAARLGHEGFLIVAVGGKPDYDAGTSITKGLDSAVNLCGSLSLLQTAALLKRVALLITGDSGIMHIAFGVGTGTLSIFGPGNEIKWAPKGEKHRALGSALDCRPCTIFGNIPPCKRAHECMSLISPEEVFDKAIELLER